MECLAKIIWSVQDFFSVKNLGEEIRSPKFTVGKKDPTEWRLFIYPCGRKEEYKDFVALYLQRLESKEVTVDYYKLGIYNKDGRLVSTTIRNNTFKDSYSNWGYDQFLELKQLDLNQGSVVVECEIKVKTSGIAENNAEGKALKEASAIRPILWKMICNNEVTDVEVKVGNGLSIPCHKLVLISGSKVIKAMFTNPDTVESQSNSITAEYGFQCMEKLVEYVYLGTLDIKNIDIDRVGELLLAADYYDIQGLKKLCENVMIENITCENVFEVLEVALKSSCEELIHKCVEFFKSNPNKKYLKQFEIMFTKYPKLGAFLFDTSLSYQKEIAPEPDEMEDNHLWQCFQNKEFTDLTIKCSDEVILCHKVILMANSEVLKDLILNLQNDTNEMVIQSFSHECLMKLMKYFYTGKLDEIGDTREELLRAATQYRLTYMKMKYEEILLKSLNVDNVLDLLDLAWKLFCNNLRIKAVEVLIENPKLLNSGEFASKSEGLRRYVTGKLVESLSVKTILLYEK